MIRSKKEQQEEQVRQLEKSLSLYRVQPWYSEDRGNLRAYGISAPVKLIDVDDILVIHIKSNLSTQDMEQLNTKLRYIFGPFTLVFAFDSDIDFLTVHKMSPEEMNLWIKIGIPMNLRRPAKFTQNCWKRHSFMNFGRQMLIGLTPLKVIRKIIVELYHMD